MIKAFKEMAYFDEGEIPESLQVVGVNLSLRKKKGKI
jgi:hypothetical protein